jgi:hypothetical protein
MADDLIQRALDQIGIHEAEIVRLKLWVNDADKMLGNEPRFESVSASFGIPALANGRAPRVWQPGEFLGKPFSSAVRSILEARHDATSGPSPASVDDIHYALTAGTFDFGSMNGEQQRQSIRISLGKNSAVFVRLPNTDLFGLVEWYPGLKRVSRSGRRQTENSSEASAEDEEAAVAAAAPEAPENEGGK